MKKQVNLTKIESPKFVSLVKYPANRTGFKIVRRRAESSLLSITLPEGATEEDAQNVMKDFSLSADYEITTQDNRVVLKRRGELADGVTVRAADGSILTVEKPEVTGELPYIALTAIRFSIDAFPDQQDVKDWLSKNGIEGEIVSKDDAFIVTRAETENDTREIELETGVVLTITRSMHEDMPMMPNITETAYGNWGWGQIDFFAAVADRDYSEMAGMALGKLNNVLENITFGDLPIDTRKELILNAVSQFGLFMATLLDMLPRTIALPAPTPTEANMDMTNITKEQDMNEAATNTREENIKEEVEIETAGTEATETVETITREDIIKMLEESNAALLDKIKRASDDASPLDAMTEIARSMKEATESIAQINQRIEKIENTTVVRSDATDPEQKEVNKGGFTGLIFGTR